MHRLFVAALTLAVAAPALAQTSDPALPDPNDTSDYVQLGLGVAMAPDYEGSNDYRLIPGAVFRAKTGGIVFFTRGTYLYADVVPAGGGIDLDAGPIAGVRLNRSGKIKDNAVDRLPDRKVALELGGFVGVTLKGLTNPYDSLSFRVDAVTDVGKAHESWVFTPTAEFGTPLSRTTFASLSLSADFASEKYADYYFGIDAAAALASGLPAYNPSKGGFKSWQLGALVGQSLSGDLRKGWGLFGTTSFKRLSGNAYADSPIVRLRGSRNQWITAAGIGYTW